MDEQWEEEIDGILWDLDQQSELKRLKAKGLKPVEPLQKRKIPEKDAFWLLVERITQ